MERLEIRQSEVRLNCIIKLPTKLPESSITHLVMTNCAINCETTGVIVEAAHRHNRLHTPDLSDNFIQDEGGEKFLGLGKRIDLLNTCNCNYFSWPIRKNFSSLKESKAFR